MTDLITEIFSSFTAVITGLADGIKEAFSHILYVDPSASQLVFSPMVLFLLVFGGLALAMGIFWKIFGVIRGKTRA